MTQIEEMAGSLGRLLGGTTEYRALARARECAEDDREIVALQNELERVQQALETALRRGEEPAREHLDEYEALMGRLQASSVYQSLVAAQTNFDKILQAVDAAVQDGMRQGSASRIIIPG